MRLVITGSSGFIGRHLVKWLKQQNYTDMLLPLRRPAAENHPYASATVVVEDFTDEHLWESILLPGDVVIHLAGLAHQVVSGDRADEIYQSANVLPVTAMAKAAVNKSVSQLLFVSSIGVHGNMHTGSITAYSPVKPDHPYVMSKWLAEQELASICSDSVDYKILRIPLVYGVDAPANFRELLKLVSHKLPLPFGAVQARKSFICIDHLVEIIYRLIQVTDTKQHCFVAADTDTVSLAELIAVLSHGMGHKTINIPVPVLALKLAFKLLGKISLYQKLCLPLVVDASQTFEMLKWVPETPARDKLIQVAKLYRQENSSSH